MPTMLKINPLQWTPSDLIRMTGTLVSSGSEVQRHGGTGRRAGKEMHEDSLCKPGTDSSRGPLRKKTLPIGYILILNF